MLRSVKTPAGSPRKGPDGKVLWKHPPKGVEVQVNKTGSGQWVEKWINPTDGKWVHNYTVETMRANAREKFQENKRFGSALPALRARYKDDLSGTGKERVLALMAALID